MKRQDRLSRLARLASDPGRLAFVVGFHVGRRVYPRYRRPVVVLYRYTSALGDNLMLTTLAREIRKRNPSALIHVVTGIPELFDRNPDVSFVSRDPGVPMPGLGRHLMRYEHRFPWRRHFLHYCAECVDIFNDIALRTYIYPSDEDAAWSQEILNRLGAAPVLVNRMAGPRTDKKNWPREYWSELVPALLQRWPVVDIGVAAEPLDVSHPRFLDLLGQTTVHQLAALTARSLLLVSPDTGVMHLAAASGLPTLVILGGSEPAVAVCYPGCRALTNRPSCCDCWEAGPCAYDFRCLRSITPAQVLGAAEEMIAAGNSGS